MLGHARTRPCVMSSGSGVSAGPGLRASVGLGACIAFGLCLVSLEGGPGVMRAAHASRADYVGAEACGRCHPAAYAAWQASAHARAVESLGPSPEGRCLACHTTGEAPAGQAFFAGVTCESCHGPGAGYAAEDIMRNPHLARAVGLRDLSTPARRAALCSTCHRAATRLAPFEPESAYRRIEHQ
jgi:hypothetical protein